MRITLKIAPILFGTVLMISCNSDDAKKKSGESINMDAVINAASKDPDAKGDNSCLLSYQQKYDALITVDEILQVTGFSKNVLQTKYNNKMTNPEYHEFTYRFDNGRVGKVMGFANEVKLPDIVAIRAIKPMSLSNFQKQYKEVTDEQMQAANDALNDVAEGNSGDQNADQALSQAEKSGVDKEQIKKSGGALNSAFKEVSKGYRSVTGLGDAASWNIVTQALVVLDKGVIFEIRADISNDTEMNKEAAIKLAEIVLAKCK